MIEDCRVNNGRLAVLEVYTQEVCRQHPELSDGIWEEFKTFVNAIDQKASLP